MYEISSCIGWLWRCYINKVTKKSSEWKQAHVRGWNCIQKLWSAWAVLGLCGMLEFKLCCELNFITAEHGRYGSMEDCVVSNAEYLVHLVRINRLSTCREFCGVHSWQNGARCRNGMKVLRCHSHLVWLVFEGSIPTCAFLFHSENFLWLVSVAFFCIVV